MTLGDRCECRGECGTEHGWGSDGWCPQVAGEPVRGRSPMVDGRRVEFVVLADAICDLCYFRREAKRKRMDKAYADIAGDPRQGRLLEP